MNEYFTAIMLILGAKQAGKQDQSNKQSPRLTL